MNILAWGPQVKEMAAGRGISEFVLNRGAVNRGFIVKAKYKLWII